MGNSTLQLGGGDARRITEVIIQSGHTFGVGDVIRVDESTPGQYVLAQADTEANAEAVGIIETVAGDSFTLVLSGKIFTVGFAYPGDATPFSAGQVWFLSATDAGELTTTPPTTAGAVIKPMLVISDENNDEAFVTGYIGIQIGSDSLVNLNNIQPVGMIIPWAAVAGSVVPTGWALCDGQALSRSIAGGGTVDTFKDLFDLLSPSLPYGNGDGSTTFNVPDLRGRTGIGLDGVTAGVLAGASRNDAGDTGGEEDHILSIQELPDHQITLGVNLVAFTGGVNQALVPLGTGNAGDIPQGFTPDPANPPSPVPGNPHNNMQPFLVLNHLIRVTEQSSVALLEHGLSDHSDVGDVSAPADCDVLKFNNGQWEAHQQFLSYRNKLINGQFDVWQRTVSFPAPGFPILGLVGFAADRWQWQVDTDGGILNGTGMIRGNFLPGEPASLGIPAEPTHFMRWEQTGITGSAGSAASNLVQRIEGVDTLNGITATLSFWMRGDIGGTIAVTLLQFPGSGGSGGLVAIQPTDVPVTAGTWTYHTITFAVPSTLGFVLGLPNDALYIRFHNQVDAPVAIAQGFPSTIAYGGVLDITNVQFEAGPLASPYEDRDIATEWHHCQRYYQSSYNETVSGPAPSTAGSIGLSVQAGDILAGGNVIYPTEMRTVPSLSIFGALTGALGVAEGPLGPSVVPLSLTNLGPSGFEYQNLPPIVVTDSLAFNYEVDAEL